MSSRTRVASLAVILVGAAMLMSLAGCAAKPVCTVNCGADKAYTDAEGRVWLPDRLLAKETDWGAVDGDTIVRESVEIPGTPCQLQDMLPLVSTRCNMTLTQ